MPKRLRLTTVAIRRVCIFAWRNKVLFYRLYWGLIHKPYENRSNKWNHHHHHNRKSIAERYMFNQYAQLPAKVMEKKYACRHVRHIKNLSQTNPISHSVQNVAVWIDCKLAISIWWFEELVVPIQLLRSRSLVQTTIGLKYACARLWWQIMTDFCVGQISKTPKLIACLFSLD